ncbi:ABC transporter permease [Geodermatophilus sabuli]|uniref:Transport permease protein n=1 Tax=Geodermatophilus sabuli TaxID=1564158 RepID=A0A285EGI6_9ACTN|nr:ABC transporter permease [Geodermatophilus sabuli]MBB3083114.1 ABC transporter DrrB family efflux protein [Geodermatophilus sabuli]SNX98110.1 ABC transporter efflux protein, DrrB family [Geodermatophilus sabuli]
MSAVLPPVAEDDLVERLRWAVTDAVTVAGRDVAHWRRQPAVVLVGALFPVLLLLMFVYLFGGAMVVPGGDYRDFLVPGLFGLAMVFGLEATMTSVVTDATRGITDRFRSLPMAPSAVVAGRCLADLGSSVLGLAVLVAAAFAVGWRPGGAAEVLAAVGLLLLLRSAFLWMGVFLGLLTRDPATVTAVQVLVWPFAFLSNAFVPASTMPGWLATIAEWNPLAATVTAVRGLFGQPVDAGGGWATEHALVLAVAWPVVLTVLFAALSVRRWQGLSR